MRQAEPGLAAAREPLAEIRRIPARPLKEEMVRNASLCAAVALALTLIVAGAGCGGDDDNQRRPSGPSMVPSSQAPPAPVRQSNSDNRAPRIDSVRFEPARLVAGARVTVHVDATDPDGDDLEFHFQWTSRSRRFSASGPVFQDTLARKGDVIEVSVSASDGRDQSEPFRVSGRVSNSAPRVRRIQLQPPGPITAGVPLRALPDAVDADGDEISYRFGWSLNGETIGEAETLETRDLRRGDVVQVSVVATDGEDVSAVFYSARFEVGNVAPLILSQPGGETGAGGGFRYLVKVRDPEGNGDLSYRLAQAPDGMTVSQRGEVEWRPSAGQKGRFAVEIVVEDRDGGRTAQRFELTVGGDGAPAS